MSKYLLFFILLFSLTTTAQQLTSVQITGSKNNLVPAKQFKWDEQEAFVNGFARVLQNNKFSFINKSTKLIAPFEFDGARNFSNHLAAVSKNNKWGFINEAGKVIIPIGYQIVFDFNENVTAAFVNNKWCLLNTNGDLIKTMDVKFYSGFKNGIAKISKDGKWGTINTKGEIVMSNNSVAATANNLQPKPFLPNSSTDISICPDNIDFEYGSFFNWQCFLGNVDSVGNTNVITVTPSPPTNNRHTLISRTLPSPIDPFGLFPVNPPDGSNFALKLGNTQIGAQAEAVRYAIHVPLNDSNFSIKYDYAVVFEDPGHTTWTQPRFKVSVFDSAANTYVDCATFEYVSTSNLPGFTRSTVDTGVMYKPWSTVFLSLRGYAGRTMFLDFTNADCVRRGHWGYAYIDVEKPCGQNVEINYDCDAPHVTTLTGPPGFQTYNWWDSTFTTLLGTGQQLVLNPGPTLNSTIWLEMIPFNNFGCLDTIPVKITGVFTANFNISDTTATCVPHTFTFYNPYLPSTSTSWDFGDGTTGTGDTVSHTYTNPGSYLVKFDVTLPNGCIGSGYKVVTVLQPVGSFSFDASYACTSSTVRFDATTSGADSLIWNFGDGTILQTQLKTVYHTYTTPGIFIPSLILQSVNGCQSPIAATDTVRIEMLNAGFTHSQITVCGNTTLSFTDTSYSYFGITSRQWNFGDNATASGTNVNHTYANSGTYNVQLIITGTSGCRDTIIKPIVVTVNHIPVAAIDGDTAQCQSVLMTFNSVVQSPDTINYYRWTSSNGLSGTNSTFNAIFNQPGTFTIQLIVGTVHGCYDTTLHQITINPTPDVVQVPNQEICNGNASAPINFTGSIAGTVYTWTNTAPSIGLAASGTGDIPSFTVISNGAVFIATITVRPIAMGCPGPAKSFTITVNPTPNVVQPVNQLLCNGSNTNAVAFTGSIPNTSYNWINSNPSIGLPANGTGNIGSFTTINNTAAPVTATITVTPMVAGCPGTARTFTFTIDPTPDVLQPADQTLCSGNPTSAINFTGAVSGTVYNWINTTPAIGLAASGTGNIASFTANNNSTSSLTATIKVSPTANGCPGTDKVFIIAVNPIPTVAQPLNQALCNGATVNAVSFTGTVTGTTFKWINNNNLIGLPSSGTGNINSFVAVNKTTAPVTATITVTPETTDCPGAAKTFTIIVNPTPVVAASNDVTVCLGNTTQLQVSGAAQYSWSPATNLSCTTCANPSANPTDSIRYTVTGTNVFGCIADDSVLLGVIKPFQMLVEPGDTLCVGESINLRAENANSYLWSPPTDLNRANIAEPKARPNVTRTYQVIGFDGHNCFTDTGYVTIVVGPKPTVNIGADRTLATGTALTLNAVTQNGPIISWMWTPAAELSCNNCPSPKTTIKNTSFYSVVVTNTFGCVATDTIFINSVCKNSQVYIPNAFTPDADGLNDVLMVRGKGMTVKSFRIFNRWGELVFERENFYPNDPKYGWDGKVRGVPATPDVFVYTAEVFCDNGVVYTYKGNTTILK
ncbi:PKD domain-containing protein [Ferruginibacter sp.]|nr:PKD domain-containing protein [Ferruginibacter sp.]